MEKIKPQFNKRFPKDARRYFKLDSDDEFKRRHPFAYGVLGICGVAAIAIPIFIFIAFIDYIYPMPNSEWRVLGIVGSFIVGVGLFNIVAAWIRQYLGHMFTIMCFLIGGVLIALSCLLIY